MNDTNCCYICVLLPHIPLSYSFQSDKVPRFKAPNCFHWNWTMITVIHILNWVYFPSVLLLTFKSITQGVANSFSLPSPIVGSYFFPPLFYFSQSLTGLSLVFICSFDVQNDVFLQVFRTYLSPFIQPSIWLTPFIRPKQKQKAVLEPEKHKPSN